MGRISRLPPDLANQIAAGEVVERPASAVKELIENALDAGARRVTVTIEGGGRRLIRVEDDGDGMDPGDAALALERHATSKIATSSDLAAIETRGFRGEALPSMASVSHVVLRTRPRAALGGTEIRVSGGTVTSTRDVGAPEGTMVEVADLFYNLPARRKFLKSDAAESAQVSRVVTQLALAAPAVGFTLASGARRVIQCPPVATLGERFYQLFGERPDLVTVSKEAAGVRIEGFAAALAQQGPTRGPQNLFVNGRIVRDRTIAHAVIDAYRVATIKERSPEVHLFFTIAPDRVDVNVHPTKAEVRFLEQSLVHEVTRRALAEALGSVEASVLELRPDVAGEPGATPRQLPGVFPSPAAPGSWSASIAAFSRTPPGAAGASTLATARGGSTAAGVIAQGASVDALGPSAAGVSIAPMVPLGQFRDTFIIAIDEDGVSIIDQHVAHERVLFELVMERLSTGRLESQRLLQPVFVDLAPGQRAALVEHAADLDRLGFEVDEFGAASVRIGAMPALLGVEDAVATVRALAGDLEGLDRGAPADAALRRLAATTACHAAVKANDPLTLEKMRYILDELHRTAYSTVCPHGRPVVLRLTRREIEKNFQRV